jgi:hypothetical protein
MTSTTATAATVFTPLTSEFTWAPSSTTAGGQPLPAGEVQTGSTIGIRADGDTTHSAGNYQWLVLIVGTGMSETAAQLAAALGKSLPIGNYWAAIDQTDTLNGQSATSAWSAEIPFSMPPTLAQPAIPTAFKVA